MVLFEKLALDPPYESNSARLRHIATEKMYLEQSLRILEEGEVRVLWDRRLFLALCFILGVFIIATVNIESSFPWSTVWVCDVLLCDLHRFRKVF